MPGFTAAGLGGAGRRSPGVPPRAGSGPKPVVFGPGSWTFTALVAGLYAFRLWGSAAAGSLGVSNDTGGPGAGGYARKTVRLAAGQAISLIVAAGGLPAYNGSGTAGSTTSANLPGGTVSATGGALGSPSTGAGGLGGIGIGGDVNLTGGNGGANALPGAPGAGSFAGQGGASGAQSGGAGGAPGDEIMKGGNGAAGDLQFTPGGFPGGGGSSFSSPNHQASGYGVGAGAGGLAIVTYEGA